MKTRHLRITHGRSMLALALLLPATALAQQPDAPPPPPPPPPAEAAPAEAPPETPPETPPGVAAEAGAPTVEDRLTDVEGKLEGMQESSAATNATVDTLKKIKLSGYIQGRYEWHDDAGAGLDASTPPRGRGTNRFLVRRARLKTSYQGTMSEFVLQIDATPDSVSLKDAEATLVLDETVIPSPTPFEVRLTMGQFKVPFGFELLQSSGDREMPERSTMVRVLYPGERDRGVRLQAKYGMFRLSTALINGNVFPNLNSSDVSYGSIDHSSFKDIVGRLGADLEFLVLGVSGHWGHTIHTTAASATMPIRYQRFERARVGADAQAYYDVPVLGGLTLRGEVIYAADTALGYAGAVADPCRSIKSLGWYATVVQNIGDHFGVVFRVDQFDLNGDIDSACMDATRRAPIEANAKIDKITTFGGGLLVHVSGNLKGTFVYEHVEEQGTRSRDNDVFTVQMQAKF